LGKRYSEWITNLYNKEHGIDTKIARCFAFVGPYMALDAQFAIANFIGDCIKQKTVVIGGDGTPYRSYLYAADLVVWLIKILLAGDNKPYNVGSDKGLQIAEIAKTVISTLCDGRLELIIKQQAKPGQVAERYIPSVERALTLGLSEYTSLTQAIEKTAVWNQRRN
jgi:nucleoside-diphosphate-sugar epimerase